MSTPLASLKPGDRGVVCGFADDSELSVDLMRMGVVEGTEVEYLRAAPTGDPLEIKVMGYALSLRREEASAVLVELSPA